VSLVLAFVDGKLLAQGEIFERDRAMTFSEQPTSRKRSKPTMVPDCSFYVAEKSIGSTRFNFGERHD
jgi:hypothetical protein